jgi:LMBR1 domain-containing protein 1
VKLRSNDVIQMNPLPQNSSNFFPITLFSLSLFPPREPAELKMASHSTTTTLIFLPWMIIVPLTVILTALLVYTYSSPRERTASTTIVSIVTLTSLLITLFLLPVDVALTSRANDPKLGARKEWAKNGEYIVDVDKGLRIMYAIVYALDVILAGVVVPWAYFWYEESLEAEEDEEEGRTAGSRFLGALKYTIFFILIIVGVFVAGIFVPVAWEKGKTGGEWKDILEATRGERAVTFAVSVMVTVGTVVYVLYTGAGLALLPVRMIKSAPAVSMAALGETTAQQLERNRERQRQLEARSDSLNSRDRRELESLIREERTLVRRERLVAENTRGEGAAGWLVKAWHKIEAVFRPLKLIGGLLLVVFTLLLWASMLITLIDKILNSPCKAKCGFLLGHVSIFQPINWILQKSSTVFPLDFILFVLLALLFFAASVTGIAAVGIRFLWITIFTIRKGRTSPQALLLATMLLTMVVFAVNFAMIAVIAPGYSTWGAQTYCSLPAEKGKPADCSVRPDAIKPCSEVAWSSGAKDICVSSVMSGIVNQIGGNWPALGVFNFWAQFAFLGKFFVYEESLLTGSGIYMVVFLTTLFKTPKLNMGDLDADLEEDEEEGLLASTGRRFNATWQDIVGNSRARTKRYGAIPQRDEEDGEHS